MTRLNPRGCFARGIETGDEAALEQADDDRAQGYLLFNQTFANRLKAAATSP